MTYNPYAAPLSPNVGSTPAPPTAGGEPLPWEIGEVLSRSWDVFQSSWLVLVPTLILTMILGSIPRVIMSIAGVNATPDPRTQAYWVTALISVTASSLLSVVIAPGHIRMHIAAARGERCDVGMLFSRMHRSPAVLGTVLLCTAATVFGTLLLLVPGIIAAIGLSFATRYAADAELPPGEAFRASWTATKGQRWKLFLLHLVLGFVLLGGGLLCCVGLLVASPVATIAHTIVYLRISGRGDAPAARAPLDGGPGYGAGWNG